MLARFDSEANPIASGNIKFPLYKCDIKIKNLASKILQQIHNPHILSPLTQLPPTAKKRIYDIQCFSSHSIQSIMNLVIAEGEEGLAYLVTYQKNLNSNVTKGKYNTSLASKIPLQFTPFESRPGVVLIRKKLVELRLAFILPVLPNEDFDLVLREPLAAWLNGLMELEANFLTLLTEMFQDWDRYTESWLRGATDRGMVNNRKYLPQEWISYIVSQQVMQIATNFLKYTDLIPKEAHIAFTVLHALLVLAVPIEEMMPPATWERSVWPWKKTRPIEENKDLAVNFAFSIQLFKESVPQKLGYSYTNPLMASAANHVKLKGIRDIVYRIRYYKLTANAPGTVRSFLDELYNCFEGAANEVHDVVKKNQTILGAMVKALSFALKSDSYRDLEYLRFETTEIEANYESLVALSYEIGLFIKNLQGWKNELYQLTQNFEFYVFLKTELVALRGFVVAVQHDKHYVLASLDLEKVRKFKLMESRRRYYASRSLKCSLLFAGSAFSFIPFQVLAKDKEKGTETDKWSLAFLIATLVLAAVFLIIFIGLAWYKNSLTPDDDTQDSLDSTRPSWVYSTPYM